MRALKAHAARASKFAGVGVLNTAVDFGAFAALTAAGVPALAGNLAAFVLANAVSYRLNGRFTFREAEPRLSAAGYLRFASVHAVSLALSSGFIALFAGALGALGAKAAAAVFTLLWNYAASAFFVFRRKPVREARS